MVGPWSHTDLDGVSLFIRPQMKVIIMSSPWKIKAYVKRKASANGGYTALIHVKSRANWFSLEYWYMRKALRELDQKALVEALKPRRRLPSRDEDDDE